MDLRGLPRRRVLSKRFVNLLDALAPIALRLLRVAELTSGVGWGEIAAALERRRRLHVAPQAHVGTAETEVGEVELMVERDRLVERCSRRLNDSARRFSRPTR